MFVDRFWNIASIIDWDYATSTSAADEYYVRLMTRGEFTDKNHDWDYAFKKLYERPFGSEFQLELSKLDELPPLHPAFATLSDPSTERYAKHTLDPLAHRSRRDAYLNLVIMVNGDGSSVIDCLDHNDGGMPGYESIAGMRLRRVFTTKHDKEGSLRKRNIPVTLRSDLRPLLRTLQEEVAYAVVRERPDLVVLINWEDVLGQVFWDGVGSPVDLKRPESFTRVIELQIVIGPPTETGDINILITATEPDTEYKEEERHLRLYAKSSITIRSISMGSARDKASVMTRLIIMRALDLLLGTGIPPIK